MSQASEIEFVFTWKIENFSYCAVPPNERLESQVFVVDKWKKRKLQLILYPRGYHEPAKLSCYTKILEPMRWKTVCLVSCYTIKGLGDFSIVTKKLKLDPVDKNTYGDKELVLREKLFNMRDIYLPKDTLTIKYHVWISDKGRKTSTLDFDPVVENVLNDKMLISAVRSELDGLAKYMNSNQCSSITHVGKGKKFFAWPIKGIRGLESNVRISIPVISALYDDPSFVLTFQFAQVRVDEIDPSVVFEIRRMETDRSIHLFLECSITALSSESDITFLKKEGHLFQRNVVEEICYFTSKIRKSGLEKYLDSTNGVLHLRCEFTYSREVNSHDTGNEDIVPLHYGIPVDEKSFDHQLNQLYETGSLSDVVLRVGDLSLKAHKNILSSRSPVFQAMFERNTKESNTGIVDILDMDPDAMNRMLLFMYSNKFINPESDQEAIALYTAADKYQVLSLKRRCLLFMQAGLSVSNVCSVLSLAHLHKEDKLMDAAKEFVCANKNQVFFSENWKALMEKNVKLCATIMFQMLTGEENFFTHKKECCVLPL